MPFPAAALPQAWKWFQDSPAFLNGRTSSEEEFVRWAQGATSWGLKQDGELVGLVLVERILWPGQQHSTDGYITFGLARRVWGKHVLLEVRDKILSHIFASLQRVTGYTSAKNKAAQRAAQYLGCREEGRLRDVLAPGEDIMFRSGPAGQHRGCKLEPLNHAATPSSS